MEIQLAELEVLSSQTHKYASTTYSGGGTDASGRATPVSSHTTHHSDQAVWVRNAGTEQELELTLTSFNIGARPGHRLLALGTDDSMKLFERLYNLSTGERNDCNGEFNAGRALSGAQRVIVTIFWAALAVMPYLQYAGVPLIVLLMLLSWLGKGSRPLTRLNSRQRLTLIVLAVAQLVPVQFPYFLYYITSGLIELIPPLLAVLLPVAFFIYTYRVTGDYNELIRARSAEIDRVLDDAVSRQKAGHAVATSILVPRGDYRVAWRPARGGA
jgi:hypothetical protein